MCDVEHPCATLSAWLHLLRQWCCCAECLSYHVCSEIYTRHSGSVLRRWQLCSCATCRNMLESSEACLSILGKSSLATSHWGCGMRACRTLPLVCSEQLETADSSVVCQLASEGRCRSSLLKQIVEAEHGYQGQRDRQLCEVVCRLFACRRCQTSSTSQCCEPQCMTGPVKGFMAKGKVKATPQRASNMHAKHKHCIAITRKAALHCCLCAVQRQHDNAWPTHLTVSQHPGKALSAFHKHTLSRAASQCLFQCLALCV